MCIYDKDTNPIFSQVVVENTCVSPLSEDDFKGLILTFLWVHQNIQSKQCLLISLYCETQSLSHYCEQHFTILRIALFYIHSFLWKALPCLEGYTSTASFLDAVTTIKLFIDIGIPILEVR